jgi:hypothetical protein
MHHHHKHQQMQDLKNLWIITVINNPVRYSIRYKLFQQFKTYIENAGANLLIVECALGTRPFEVTETNNPYHIQLRTTDMLWHKENMINIGISHLPDDWKYVAWIDSDIQFMRTDWLEETVHQLQHYKVIQLFQNAIDLGPNGEVLSTFDSFMWSWQTGQPNPYSMKNGISYYPHWHPGYAWAATREAINELGGLLDKAILGAADHHMAWALVGNVIENTPIQVSDAYKKYLNIWQERANTHIQQNVGYMPGSIYHFWHGKKKDRKYVERWEIILNHNFDPELDIKRDWQGLYQFSHNGTRMRNDIRKYFMVRNEDSIDV